MDSRQPNHSQPGPLDADTYFEQAKEYRYTEDYEHAIAAVTRAIQRDLTNAKYYNYRAEIHFVTNHWDEAIADYTEALRLQPDPNDNDEWNFTIADVYDDRAMAYRWRGDYEAALADYAELIRLEPDKPRHYTDRSIVYKLKGDFENSFADLYTAQRLDPDRFDLTLMVDLHRRQGNKNAEMTVYDEAIEKGGSPQAFFSRGRLWKEQGEFAKAIADFEEAIRRYQHPWAYTMLAAIHVANGDFAKAIDVLNPVMMPEGYAYAIRGDAHAALGHIAEAVADYQMALELQPTHPEADKMRAYITTNS